MKDNKICFNKTLLVLVLLLVGVVAGLWAMNANLGNNSKAAGLTVAGTTCPASYNGLCHKVLGPNNTYVQTGLKCLPFNGGTTYTWQVDSSCGQEICYYGNKNVYDSNSGYTVASGGCIQDSNSNNVGAKCVAGNMYSQYDSTNCAKPAAAPRGCYYGGVNVDDTNNNAAVTGYGIDTNDCVLQYNRTSQTTSKTGYKCVAASSTNAARVSRRVTDSNDACYVSTSTARTACAVGSTPVGPAGTTSGYDYVLDANNCILYRGSLTGYKCDPTTFKNNYSSDCVAKKSSCTIFGLPVTSVSGYSMNGSCIQYNGKNIGIKCDASTNWLNKKDTDVSSCGVAAATCDPNAQQPCSLGGKSYPYGSCLNAGNGYYYKCACDTNRTLSAPTLVGPLSTCP